MIAGVISLTLWFKRQTPAWALLARRMRRRLWQVDASESSLVRQPDTEAVGEERIERVPSRHIALHVWISLCASPCGPENEPRSGRPGLDGRIRKLGFALCPSMLLTLLLH